MIKFYFEIPELGFQFGDLAPMMSQETVSFHYGMHFRIYVDKLNELVNGSAYEGLSLGELVKKVPNGPIADNAGQVHNHTLFFEQFVPSKDAKIPTDELRYLVEQSFGSFETMKDQMNKAALSLFGSGWVFLVMDEACELKVMSLHNGDSPLRYDMIPLLAIDVWEHAYYLDYQNRRKDYLKNLWLMVNWRVVSSRIV